MRYVTTLALCLAAPFAALADPLPSWNPTATEAAILGFVSRVTDPGSPDFVPEEDRIAVFDNDGTLWSEQPMYFQGLFALDKLREKAKADPAILTSDAPRAANAAVPAMRRIPGGIFPMGSDRHYPEEAPAHLARVAGFGMDETMVTNRRFSAFAAATGHVTVAERPLDPSRHPGADPAQLVPGGLVFRVTAGPVDTRDLRDGWRWPWEDRANVWERATDGFAARHAAADPEEPSRSAADHPRGPPCPDGRYRHEPYRLSPRPTAAAHL